MQDKVSPEPPSSIFRAAFAPWLRRVSRWVRMAVAAVLMLAGMAALVLHVWILPRINEFRPYLERNATQVLGLPVRIGEIALTARGWQPEIELRDVQFHDAAGNAALQVERIQAVVSLETLARRGFARLTVIAPRLQAQRLADGRVQIAGLLLEQNSRATPDGATTEAAIDWLLAQPVLEITGGSIRWSDAQRNAPALLLSNVQASLHNRARQHALQVQMTPPAGWGQPINTVFEWRHGFFQRRADWGNWTGVAYANMPQLDVSQLRRYVDLGRHVNLQKGQGSLQLWAQFAEGFNSTFTADAKLDAVDVTLGKDLPPLALKNVQTLLTVQYANHNDHDSYTVSTSRLGFTTYDDIRWPGGNVKVTVKQGIHSTASSGQVQGSQWDIGIIGQLAERLPLGEAMLKALATYQPHGQVDALLVDWKGDINQPESFSARGKAHDIGWLAHDAGVNPDNGHPIAGMPGLQGATLDFDFGSKGGQLKVNIDKGHAEFPGVFEEPRLPFDALQAQLRWTVDGEKIRLEVPDIRFANADLKGHARIGWHTLDGAATAQARFPGVMDLEGTLQQVRAERVVRYLPLVLGHDARTYVKNAIRSGDVRNATVRIQGDLSHVPFGRDAKGVVHPGTFRFDVPLFNTEFAFVPAYLQHPGDKPWPSLTRLNGKLVIDKQQLSVFDATARLSTAPDVQVTEVAAHIPDLGHNLTVGVAAKMTGPLQQALNVTAQTPVSDFISKALDKTTATGNANITLVLGLPILQIHASQVKGTVQLQGNDIRMTPSAPLLARSQGSVNFSEHGFGLQQVSTQLLGGRATLEGGFDMHGKTAVEQTVTIQAQGDFTGEGLRNEPTVGTIAALGQFLQGRSRYQALLQFRQGTSEMRIDTDLAGMAMQLPFPLNKPAGATLPLHFANTISKTGKDAEGKQQAVEDQVLVQLGKVVLVQYQRKLHPQADPQVLRGSLAIGAQALANLPPLPDSGVHALVNIEKVDADAWSKVLDAGWGDKAQTARTPVAPEAVQSTASGYLPDRVAIITPLLTVANRSIESLVVGGAREGRLWKLSMAARQINGYVEYLQSAKSGPGSVKARLSQLVLEPANVEQVTAYVKQTQDPETLPALDIDAQNVDLLGYKLERLVLRASTAAQARPAGAALVDEGVQDARNAWRIHQLSAWMPHGTLQGSGVWGMAAGQAASDTPLSQADQARRFVGLNVRLDSTNLGGLLAHFGQPDLLSGGAGSMAGTIRWRGSPVSPDMATLAGNVRLDVRQGRITKIDPGAAKLIGLLSLNLLPRLGDITAQGFGFDRISGTVRLGQGVAHTTNLAVDGIMADVKVAGQATLQQPQTIALDVVVQPKIDLGGAALLATAINPVIGLGTYVAQWVLHKPISALATQVMTVKGPLKSPQVQRLQGQEARSVAQRVLANHQTPVQYERLWDWTPITGQRNAPAPSSAPAQAVPPLRENHE